MLELVVQIALFNTCLAHFRNILKRREKQRSLDRFLLKCSMVESDENVSKKKRTEEEKVKQVRGKKKINMYASYADRLSQYQFISLNYPLLGLILFVYNIYSL